MAATTALIAAVLFYAAGNLLQSWAAAWADRRKGLDPGLLPRLFADPLYVVGFGCQVAGFGLAFLASAQLPLYVVQSGLVAAVGVSVVVGVLLLGWRLARGEVFALIAMTVGLILIGSSAVPSQATEPDMTLGLALTGVVLVIVLLAVPASRLSDPRAAIALGVLAGIGFSVVAVLARPLAATSLIELPVRGLFWLFLVAALVSQALFAMSLQRGTASAVAAMQASSTVPASVAGVLLLGDQVAEDQHIMVFAGLALVVAGTLALTILAAPTRRRHPANDGGPVLTSVRRVS